MSDINNREQCRNRIPNVLERIGKRAQQNVMYRSLGQRLLGEVFEEALREQSEARVGKIPKGTRKLAEVFEEAKREGEEARARENAG